MIKQNPQIYLHYKQVEEVEFKIMLSRFFGDVKAEFFFKANIIVIHKCSFKSLVKVLNHEFMHSILERLGEIEASIKLDLKERIKNDNTIKFWISNI